MVYELLKRAIEQKNSFMTMDIIRLQIEFFYTAGRLTEQEHNELMHLLDPTGEDIDEDQPGEPEIIEDL